MVLEKSLMGSSGVGCVVRKDVAKRASDKVIARDISPCMERDFAALQLLLVQGKLMRTVSL